MTKVPTCRSSDSDAVPAHASATHVPRTRNRRPVRNPNEVAWSPCRSTMAAVRRPPVLVPGSQIRKSTPGCGSPPALPGTGPLDQNRELSFSTRETADNWQESRHTGSREFSNVFGRFAIVDVLIRGEAGNIYAFRPAEVRNCYPPRYSRDAAAPRRSGLNAKCSAVMEPPRTGSPRARARSAVPSRYEASRLAGELSSHRA